MNRARLEMIAVRAHGHSEQKTFVIDDTSRKKRYFIVWFYLFFLTSNDGTELNMELSTFT